MWDDFDKRFLEKVQETIESEKRTQASFDRMEQDAELFQKLKITHKINNTSNSTLIPELWEQFKVLEKRTRLYKDD